MFDLKICAITLAIVATITIAASFILGHYERYKRECESLNGVVVNNNSIEYVCIKKTALVDI